MDRIDWPAIRDRIDLAAVATSLLGPAPGRRGGKAASGGSARSTMTRTRRSTSTRQADLEVLRLLRTWGRRRAGDEVEALHVSRGRGLPGWQARPLGEADPPEAPGRQPRQGRWHPPEPASGLPLADALQLVEDAAERLWTPEGADALAYLKGRGLTEATIKAARLGWTPRVSIPVKDGTRFWKPRGSSSRGWIATAWRWSRSASPRGASRSTPKRTATAPRSFQPPRWFDLASRWSIVEGEFDALLLGQELADLAAVVTLGVHRPAPRDRPSGDVGRPPVVSWPTMPTTLATRPPRGGRPVRPSQAPGPCKDWTEAFLYPINLRRWWTETEFVDFFDRGERAAIMEFEVG